jgi:hypothetical protein
MSHSSKYYFSQFAAVATGREIRVERVERVENNQTKGLNPQGKGRFYSAQSRMILWHLLPGAKRKVMIPQNSEIFVSN